MRSVVGGLTVALLSASAHAASDEALCKKVVKNLIPLEISKQVYPTAFAEEPTYHRYVGHQLLVTKFSFPPPYSIPSRDPLYLYSGYLLFDSHSAIPNPEQIDARLSMSSYFKSRGWGLPHMGDVAQTYPSSPGVDQISSIVLYFKYGRAADVALKSRLQNQFFQDHFPDHGLRGSKIEDWYSCQSCDQTSAVVPEGQDLRTVRVSQFDGRTFILTIAPRFIVAEVKLDRSRMEYFECRMSLAFEVELDTLRAQERADNQPYEKWER